MQQTIIKIGNSSGIILPKELMAQVGLKTGSKVQLEQALNGQGFSVVKGGKNVAHSSITPYFLNIVEKVNKRYSSALKSLANK